MRALHKRICRNRRLRERVDASRGRRVQRQGLMRIGGGTGLRRGRGRRRRLRSRSRSARRRGAHGGREEGLARAGVLDGRVAADGGAVDDLVPADGFPDFVAEFVEELHVAVRCDVRPEAAEAEEAAAGRRELHERDGLQTEGRGEVGFEEGFEDLVGEDDHAERGEAEIGLVGLYLRCRRVFICAFGSGQEGVTIFERVGHEATDSAEVRIADFIPEDKLMELRNEIDLFL